MYAKDHCRRSPIVWCIMDHNNAYNTLQMILRWNLNCQAKNEDEILIPSIETFPGYTSCLMVFPSGGANQPNLLLNSIAEGKSKPFQRLRIKDLHTGEVELEEMDWNEFLSTDLRMEWKIHKLSIKFHRRKAVFFTSTSDRVQTLAFVDCPATFGLEHSFNVSKPSPPGQNFAETVGDCMKSRPSSLIMAVVTTCTQFRSLGLHQWLTKQCKEMGIKKPTEIQEKTIPQILKGNNCIGCAKTGSGKTAAFALPILQKLSEDPYGIFALVLTPTRELAYQISDQFEAFGKTIGLKSVVVVGGIDSMKQSIALSNKPHIIIATPGRLADLLRTTDTFSLGKIKFLVLDEADRLFEDSFASDLDDIFERLPKERQTLLFTATLTEPIRALKETSNKPFFYEVKSDVATVAELDQRFVLVPTLMKDPMLVYILRECAEDKSVIIFTSTCRNCQVLAYTLRKIELQCVALHSLMSQNDRLSTLARFRGGIVKILVSTDVASRGLDIPTVDLVINSNVPANPTDYIHRVGRTARAGRGGMAITLMTQYDIERVKAVEERINTKLEEFETNEKEVLKLLKPVSVVKREVELRLSDSNFGEKREINKRKKRILENGSAKRKRRRRHNESKEDKD